MSQRPSYDKPADACSTQEVTDLLRPSPPRFNGFSRTQLKSHGRLNILSDVQGNVIPRWTVLGLENVLRMREKKNRWCSGRDYRIPRFPRPGFRIWFRAGCGELSARGRCPCGPRDLSNHNIHTYHLRTRAAKRTPAARLSVERALIC